VLDRIANGALTVGDIRNGPPGTRTLLSGDISPATAPEEGSEMDALGALLRNILDALSVDELADLPEPVWALLEYVASPDAEEPSNPPASA
jgi:hypothetical protein